MVRTVPRLHPPLAAVPALIVLASAGAACTPAPPPALPTVQVAVPTPTAPPAEPAGFRCEGVPFQDGDRSYCVYSNRLPWIDAKRACADTGGQLVSFGPDQEARAMLRALGPSVGAGEGLWIGLSEPQKGTWKWLDGSIVSFPGWYEGEPNDDGGDEDCAEWKLGAGTWNDAPCSQTRGYLCEKIPGKPMTCQVRSVRTTAGEYCVHLIGRLSWHDAQLDCDAAGGTLAILSTEEENKLLYQAAGPKVGLDRLWIGLSDMAHEGSWKWVSGERLGHPWWKLGEPNDFQGNEDCAEWFSENGMLNDLACAERRPYVCEPAAPAPAPER